MIGSIVANVAYVLFVLIFIRAILSFIPNVNPRNPAVELLYQVTEPILAPIRGFMPRTMLDFSPMIAGFILLIIARVATGSI